MVTRWRCDWLQSAWRGRLFRQDRQCTVWSVRVTIVAVETRQCAVCMKLHVSANSIEGIERCTSVLLWTVSCVGQQLDLLQQGFT